MKRVLIFEPIITNNGISKIISDFIMNFDQKIDCEILTFKIENDIYIKNLDIKIHEIGIHKNIFKRIKKEKIIMKENFDVVHVNGNYISRVIECISAKLVGVKQIIIHSHNTGCESNRKLKTMIHSMLKFLFGFFATDYLACSKEAAKWMYSKSIIKKQKYEVIPNGIDLKKFRYNEKMRNKIRKNYHCENKYVIGFVGRLSYQKNPIFLIEVFNECKKINKNLQLMIIGEGELKPKVIEYVNQLNLSKDVIFLGNVVNVFDYYNAMDCFLLPSLYEGMGIVNIEAQVSGLPTIVSDQVPKEVQISPLIQFVDLNNSKKWIDKILNHKRNENREKWYQELKNCSYSIQDVSERLEGIYLK